MTQKQIAKRLKKEFDVNYSIQGHNVFVKSSKDISNKIKIYLESLNKEKNLGYKRFYIVSKNKGRKLIGSVPFGIAITLN